MKRVAVSQPRYLPAVNYLQRIVTSDAFVLLDDVQHNRRVFEQRNRVRDKTGERWLSIPISRAGGSRPLIKDLVVDDGAWVDVHVRSLKSWYKDAPHWDGALVERLYDGIDALRSFTDIAETQLRRTLAELDLPGADRLVRSTRLECTAPGDEKLAQLTRKLDGEIYISGPNGRAYIEPAHFEGLVVEFHEYDFPTYPQLGEQFIPWLAWLDAMFMIGKARTRAMVFEGGRWPRS